MLLDIKSLDQLAYFMQSGLLRLSKYDLKFVQNLYRLISEKHPITTNQVALFLKLTKKYSRQLSKQKIFSETIESLNWNIPVIDSDKKFTETFVTIEKDKLIFRSPYNKNFLKELRSQENNYWVWDKVNRAHVANFCCHNLKIICQIARKHFAVTNYCTVITNILNQLKQFDNVKFWTPTLCNLNGMFIISAANKHIMEAIQHIPLNNDMKTLSILSEYGIAIDQSVIQKNESLEFASKFKVEIDYKDKDKLVEWLKLLGCSIVYEGSGLLLTHKKELKSLLEKNGIKVLKRINSIFIFSQNINENIQKNENLYSVLIQGTETASFDNVKKIITIKNSEPIDLKGSSDFAF